MVGKCYETLFLSPEDHLDVENNQEEGDANPCSSNQGGDDLDEQFSLKSFSAIFYRSDVLCKVNSLYNVNRFNIGYCVDSHIYLKPTFCKSLFIALWSTFEFCFR